MGRLWRGSSALAVFLVGATESRSDVQVIARKQRQVSACFPEISDIACSAEAYF